MRVAVLTISDSASKGEREDLSGPAVIAFCRGLGWEVTSSLCVSDDPADVREQLRTFAEIVARVVTTEHPSLVTNERSVAKRPVGRVLIDVQQNDVGRELQSKLLGEAQREVRVFGEIGSG